MLHIILLILKIIGIILLGLLGLILLILLTVLLVPIRYRLSAEHGEALDFEGRVSWLLHLVHARFSHHEGKTHIRIRIFGFIFYDNLKPRKPKVKKRRHKASVSKQRNRKSVNFKNNSQADKDTKSIIKQNIKTEDLTSADKKEQDNRIETSLEANKMEELDQNKADTVPINFAQSKQQAQSVYDQENIKTSTEIISRSQPAHREERDGSEGNKKASKNKKPSLLIRIKEKLKIWKEKALSWIKGIKDKIRSILEGASNIHHKIILILEFLKDELNKEGFHATYQSVKKLLKHILPTKLQSKIIFGTGDPCSTGQALGILGILYGYYGDKIQIVPDFENSRFEGKHYARGRIRLITILIIVIKLILDKRFKLLRRNFQILKEAL